MINLYSLLQIDSAATKEEIKDAYYIRKTIANDRNTRWLIEEAYILLSDDNNREKYDALILKDELAKKQDINKSNPILAKNQDKIPKLLLFIIWLFSIECGAILFKNIKGTILFALSANNSAVNNALVLVSVIGLAVTLIPVVLGVLAVTKRLKIAIAALMIVAVLHLIRNVISFLMFNIIVDSATLIIYPTISLCLLIFAVFNNKSQAWLNVSAVNKKGSIALFSICSIIYMLIFAIGLKDMKNQIPQEPRLSDSEMKYLGTTGKYYYYLDLSKEVTTTSNGYIIPIVITDTTAEQSQYQTNIIVDNKTQKYCMENSTTDCSNPSSFKLYELASPVNEAIQYIEGNKEHS